MNKNNGLAIVLVLVLTTVVRFIGIEKIPFPVIIIILGIAMTIAFIIVLKYRGSKKERTYLITMTILITLLLSVVIIAVVTDKYYSQISLQYKPIFIVLLGILFIALLLVAIANAIYKLKNKYNSEKH